MAEFSRSIQGPDLRGLGAPARQPVGDSRAATAQLATALLTGAAGFAGNVMAQRAGRRIGGEGESLQEASSQVALADQELQGLIAQEQDAVGGPVSPEQAEDLRKEVFDRVLRNQKRIRSALERGLISSTEANARMDVLRNQALSNPLIAPFQNQLDNALYRTTGGSGTFGATAAELEAQAQAKGNLAAAEEAAKETSRLMRIGVAASEQQARNIMAQMEEYRMRAQYYSDKKALLGLTSQEVYAMSQMLGSQQAASALNTIAEWSQAGGDAQAKQGIQLRLVQEGEAIKNAIRNNAFDDEGNLLVEESTLRSQLEEVDRRVSQYTEMLNDQSGTQHLMNVIGQRNAALDYETQTIQIELAKYAPLLYALKDQPPAQQWYWDFVTAGQGLATKWSKASNPVLQWVAKLHPEEITKTASDSASTFIEGGKLTEVEAAVVGDALTRKGGTNAVDAAMENAPDQTLRNLREVPVRLRDLYGNNEWLSKARTPEGSEQVGEIVKGAANRAIISSMYNTTRRETAEEAEARGSNRRRWSVPAMTIPRTVQVTQKAPSRSNIPRLFAGEAKVDWIIDTGGVPVSDEYKSEIVNAYKLGTQAPNLWNEDFETIDEWINHLFARPEGGASGADN